MRRLEMTRLRGPTNVTVSFAGNVSTTFAPSQTAASAQSIRTYNHQLTTTTNNLSIVLMTNQVVTAETNSTISYVTNLAVSTATNVAMAPSGALTNDYFLCLELIPPPDFTLQSGESLILLVDGVRHGFTQGASGTAFTGRKGFTSGLYRVPPEVLVAIANAKEVRVRLKGAQSVVEKNMNAKSRRNFRDFLLKYFQPESTSPNTAALVASSPLASR